MSEVDDTGLLERARRGDEDAFSRLFAGHQRMIYRYAAYMCGPDAGDDIERAVFYDEDDRFLVERDGMVSHFDVVYRDEPARIG